nr:NPXTG-anchored protein [Ruminococcus sp.]
KTTKNKTTTKGKAQDSPVTGVAGVGVAAAGLAIAVGTAFALRKKED